VRRSAIIERGERMSRVKHIAYVVNDLEESASFFEDVLGMRRYSKVKRPGNFPGDSMLITDGELNVTLLAPDSHIERREWNQGTAGPNHIGIEAADAPAIYEKLKQRGIRTYGEEQSDRPRFFKFRDPNGVEIDVSVPERGWPIPAE
jgi:catechol 2,3-dioxygenase-like lactoylglutathione lyase family enzyme